MIYISEQKKNPKRHNFIEIGEFLSSGNPKNNRELSVIMGNVSMIEFSLFLNNDQILSKKN
jgi:hypothetical protein